MKRFNHSQAPSPLEERDFMNILDIFSPAPHIEKLAEEKIDPEYKKLRWQVFMGIFLGYAGYYLVRKNFALAIPYLLDQGFTKGEMGFVMSALAISYGLSKFVMGTVSDRCNPKYFIVTGLVLSSLVLILFGTVPMVLESIWIMFGLMFINGWVQGMGWPPCGRTMVHWFSISERGTKMAIWNVAHNIGGGLMPLLVTYGIFLVTSNKWDKIWELRSVFLFPAAVALIVAIVVFYLMKDTPQSEGLPPIEEYSSEYPSDEVEDVDREKELTTKEILFKYVLNNKYLWYIALANIFVYMVRYGVCDWAPTYLTEVKGFSHDSSRWSFFLYEYAGIPGTILCGWMSDRFFQGRRAPAGVLFMVGVTVAVFVYWFNPPGNPLIDNIALISIGFLIYGPVMLIGLHALDLVPKKAAGTAAGLTGLFGYLFGTAILANWVMGIVVDKYKWDGGFIMLIASCFLAIFFLSLTWNAGSIKED